MEKVNIHPLTQFALIISSITMGVFSYQNFNADNTAYGIVFIVLAILLLTMVVYGFVRNRKTGEQQAQQN
ncbi:hypothetical protein [Planomicrobium sp. Y74]|uniref:hypothetical protein n=1 Tax=Planomicrobium sp. Y74 TaxID=2478977 RepID=UPI000EF465D9|nr:hypothetical protein [Planomicrobium sp. Y74]RLQ86591.1 hypothetical protein D9754_14250 [Planomicrobium sp. Y74]